MRFQYHKDNIGIKKISQTGDMIFFYFLYFLLFLCVKIGEQERGKGSGRKHVLWEYFYCWGEKGRGRGRKGREGMRGKKLFFLQIS